ETVQCVEIGLTGNGVEKHIGLPGPQIGVRSQSRERVVLLRLPQIGQYLPHRDTSWSSSAHHPPCNLEPTGGQAGNDESGNPRVEQQVWAQHGAVTTMQQDPRPFVRAALDRARRI